VTAFLHGRISTGTPARFNANASIMPVSQA
jgi:hypothetical protein